MAHGGELPARARPGVRDRGMRANRHSYGDASEGARVRVRFYDPYLVSGYEKAIGVERAFELDDLLRESDIVSMHVPLDKRTEHLIDAPQFRLMKKTAYVVNTSRGPVVRYDALVEALAAGRIAGAGLDVLEHEPAGGEIMMRFPNVIVTPHSAFYSQESLLEMRRKSALTVREALVNGRFMNIVNGVQAGGS